MRDDISNLNQLQPTNHPKQSLAEDWVISHAQFKRGHELLLEAASWRKQPPSPGQLGYLKQLGVELPFGGRFLSKGDASLLIDGKLKAPATDEQRERLKVRDRL
jgi:hypothetical protein